MPEGFSFGCGKQTTCSFIKMLFQSLESLPDTLFELGS
jgi:hypothetical protein